MEWLKLENGDYVRLGSVSSISVDNGGGGGNPYRVVIGAAIVKSGFATDNDAQAALDNLMSHIGFVEV